MTEKANTSWVVSGSAAEFFFCLPNISPPPGGKQGFTLGRRPERFFHAWDWGKVRDCL